MASDAARGATLYINLEPCCHTGRTGPCTQALIAAGTGLGEAMLTWNGNRYIVMPSEGGHADFAPRTEREIELLRYLKTLHKFVSFELIVSGSSGQVIATL